MPKKIAPGWFCEECGKELFWEERGVLISGGEMNLLDEGPSADKEPWWGVYHEDCYGKRFNVDG